MKKIVTFIPLLFLFATFSFGQQLEKKFRGAIKKKIRMEYLLHLPESYHKEKEKQWPLMLFLHGAGERGTDLSKVKKHGPPKLVETDPAFPFILVSPQCPEGERWDHEKLYSFLLNIIDRYRVDRSRIYLTGLSMGGFGTWDLACAHPELFAAIAPICGGGIPFEAKKLADIPVWVFHGEDDTIVPIQRSEEMVAALERAGGNVKFTRYKATGHDSWSRAYAGDELFTWFLSIHKTR